MPTNKEIFNAKMDALANSINTKAGLTGAKDLDDLKDAVDGITVGVDTSDATATVNDILSGKSAYGAAGTKLDGTIPTRTSSDLQVLANTVSAPSGYYASSVSKSVANGSVTIPTTSVTANPSISVSNAGLITATTSGSGTVTPTVSAGYVSSVENGSVSVSGSATSQLSVQAAQTITPTTADQTIASGKYLTGAQTIKGDAKLIPANIAEGVTIFGVQGTHQGGGYTKPSYLISDGDTVSTFYFNKDYAIKTFLASLTYSDLDPNTGLYVCMLGFSNPSTLNNLFAVDLTGGEYAIVWNDGTTVTPIYASVAVPAFGVTTAGWQVGSFTPDSSVTVDEDYINASFLAIMDSVVAKDDVAFGEHGGGGNQPQLNAPSISISQMSLTITNPATNGNFVSGYKIFADGTQVGTTSNTTYDLSGLSANTASITVKATGTNFVDSAASTAVTFYKYFTVNMYDDDKTTLLQTESVRYGLMPTYTPTKAGYALDYWTDINGTQITEITANANLYAVWVSTEIYIPAGQYKLRTTVANTSILDYTATFYFKTKNAVYYSTGVSVAKNPPGYSGKWYVVDNPEKKDVGTNAKIIGFANVSGSPASITWTVGTTVNPITVETNQQVDAHAYELFTTLFETV